MVIRIQVGGTRDRLGVAVKISRQARVVDRRSGKWFLDFSTRL